MAALGGRAGQGRTAFLGFLLGETSPVEDNNDLVSPGLSDSRIQPWYGVKNENEDSSVNSMSQKLMSPFASNT